MDVEKTIIIKKENMNQLINVGSLKTKQISIKRLDYISLVKILSACFVILKHTNNSYWFYKEYSISINIICSLCMCAVPLFALCIGATLLNFNEKYGILEYWKRRILKIIIPIIGWNVFYYIFKVYIIKNFPKIKLNFINIYNLYFYNKLYGIISSLRIFMFGYMVIPLIALIDKKEKIKLYSYGLIIILINQSTIPYIINILYNYTNLLSESSNTYIIDWPYNYNSGYIVYLFSGYIIQNKKLILKYKLILYVFGIFGLFLRLMISHDLTLKHKMADRTQIKYINLPIVIYSCSVFLFIKENSKFLFKIINKKYIHEIGSLSLGPFFLHNLIIETLPRFYKYSRASFNYRIYGFILISITCFLIAFIIKKIPLIKYLIP